MSEFSQEDIEKMRRMVQDHDAQHKGPAIVDLNNPPKAPYKFQKFPMMVYNHAQSKPARDEKRVGKNGVEIVHVPAKLARRTVNNEQELELARKTGWSEKPPEYKDEKTPGFEDEEDDGGSASEPSGGQAGEPTGRRHRAA